MKCCGQARNTAYCPDCGRRVSDSPLVDLLAHARRQVTLQKKALALWTAPAEATDPVPSPEAQRRREGNAERHARLLAKWQSWADALADVLAGPEPGGPVPRPEPDESQ
jgi:hypothetical protein